MKVLTLYLETTVPNLLVDEGDKQRHPATKRLFEEIKEGKYQAAISDNETGSKRYQFAIRL